MITILTPTYNRAKNLPDLYMSLYNQTKYNFEWLVVDDGSEDATEDLIENYILEAPFSIRYLKKSNGGKHSALNVGFKESIHEWVFIVDSDDVLSNDAIQTLLIEINSLTDDFNSVCILRSYTDGSVIGNEFPNGMKNYLDRVYNKVKGDKADIIRKDAVRDFAFPEYSNENFMAESPLYLWLGTRGKTKFINYKGYICEYLSGGLTDNSIKNRYRCINSTLYVYKTQYDTYSTHILKAKAGINWWRFKLFNNIDNLDYKMPLFYIPAGVFLHIFDKLKKR